MRTKLKSSVSSRTSVRGLIVACLPAAALGVIANSPVLGAVFSQLANQGLTTDDHAGTNGASTHAPSTNSTDTPRFDNDVPTKTAGQRG